MTGVALARKYTVLGIRRIKTGRVGCVSCVGSQKHDCKSVLLFEFLAAREFWCRSLKLVPICVFPGSG